VVVPHPTELIPRLIARQNHAAFQPDWTSNRMVLAAHNPTESSSPASTCFDRLTMLKSLERACYCKTFLCGIEAQSHSNRVSIGPKPSSLATVVRCQYRPWRLVCCGHLLRCRECWDNDRHNAMTQVCQENDFSSMLTVMAGWSFRIVAAYAAPRCELTLERFRWLTF